MPGLGNHRSRRDQTVDDTSRNATAGDYSSRHAALAPGRLHPLSPPTGGEERRPFCEGRSDSKPLTVDREREESRLQPPLPTQQQTAAPTRLLEAISFSNIFECDQRQVIWEETADNVKGTARIVSTPEDLQGVEVCDPFADATKGDDRLPAGTEEYIHIRIQQRNGRKTLTTVQGIADDYDKKKLVKAFKKKFACNGTVIEHPEYGEVIQLQGDQRKNICQFLLEVDIVKEEQLKVHGF
ncbi:hypothetical protein chiPu_0008026 [Chiloscyllium punctatum]|uniref:SUI1 domain-containing protein n=1 Tax=Chiloscyllium punctatum TaxID=137246 RepID=A0A401SGV9_CHIPU|nr:hypothetical protein [Chiloscyllium punctatum]